MRWKFATASLTVTFAFLVLSFLVISASNSSPALDAFFSELDNNHDGAIDVHEASNFIGGSIGGHEFDEPQEAADAATSFLKVIDGGDAGLTVSVDELDVHLHSVLRGVRVWEWIRYGVGLPQYAEAFRAHSITPLDFPVLVQDNGKTLEEELGVSSPFHRAKLVRAIRRQILGLGQPPSEPQAVTCVTASPRLSAATTAVAAAGGGGYVGGRARVHWSPPADPGVPPLHRYVLERAGADGQWRQVAELDDPQPAAVAVALEAAAAAASTAPAAAAAVLGAGEVGGLIGPTGGQILYRVAAWNLYGRSPYGWVTCQLDPAPPPGYPLLAAADAANGTTGDEAAAAVAVAAAVPREPPVPRSRGGGSGGDGGGGGDWGWSPVASPPFSPSDPGGPCCQSGGAAAEAPEPGWRQSTPGDAELLRMLLQRQSGAAPEAAVTVTGGGAGGGGAALSRTLWSSGSEPQSYAQSPTQAWSPPPASAPPPARSWWSTALLAALPWLLRLLPLWVLRAAADGGQRLLLRAHAAVGWPPLPPDWRPPPQPQPALLRGPQCPDAAAPFSSQAVTAAQIGATAAADGGGGGRGLRVVGPGVFSVVGGSGGRERMSVPGAVPAAASGGSAGGNGAAAAAGADPAAVPSVAAATTSLTQRSRSQWLQGLFPAAAQAVPPLTGTEPEAALLSRRSGMPPYQPQSTAPTPYGSPGADISALMMTHGAGGSSATAASDYSSSRSAREVGAAPVSGLMAPAPPLAAAAATPRPPPCCAPAHRSTSEGDICGLEDAERPSFSAFLHPQVLPQRHTGSPTSAQQLRSQLTAHQLAGSAPSLSHGLGLGLGPTWAGGRLPGGLSSLLQGGAAGGSGLQEAGTEGDLLEMAAAAARGGGGGSGGAGGVSGHGRGKLCAIPGCGRKLDLRHYRDYMRRHYCGRCQRTVCGPHTAYSPHGLTGSCDHVSRCVCTSCFTHFNPAYQQFLLKHNKLHPAGGPGLHQGEVLSGPAGLPLSQVQQEVRGGRGGSANGSRFGSANGGARSEHADGDDKSAAKLLWERAATKLKAVTRFRKKGSEGYGHQPQELGGIVE